MDEGNPEPMGGGLTVFLLLLYGTIAWQVIDALWKGFVK